MNKKTLMYGCILLIVLGIFFLLYMYVYRQRAVVSVIEEQEVATTTQTLHVEVNRLDYIEGPNKAVLEYVYFPKQLARSPLAELNLRLDRDARETFQKNKKELEDNLVELKKYGMDLEGREFVHERMVDKSRIYTNQSAEVISIVFSNYVDFGGAHGSFFYDSAVYDMKTGLQVTLRDILTGDYEKFLGEHITNQIIQKTATCKNCENLGGKIDPVDGKIISDSFSLSAGGITFLYGAYDLGSYAETAAGQEVFVSKEVLAEFIQRQW